MAHSEKDGLDPAQPDTGTQAKKVRIVPILVLLTIAVIAAVKFKDQLSFEALAQHREALIMFRDANYLAMIGAFVATYAAIVAFSLPGATIATLTGGFLFATFPGVIFNVMGASLGAMALFLAVRWGLGDYLASKMDTGSGPVQKIKQSIDENQWSALFVTRLVPAVPFFVANLLPAFFGVPFYRYAISTVIGIIPGALVYTSVGAGLGDVFARGEAPNLGVIFEPQILLPILGLCALALLPIALKALRKKDDVV